MLTFDEKIEVARSVAENIDPHQLAQGLFELGNAQAFISSLVPGTVSNPPTNSQLAHATFALQGELHELADSLGWKQWKDNPVMDGAQQQLVAEEFADVLAFLGLLIYLMILRSGLDLNQLADAYRNKSLKNIRRFEGTSGEPGYNGVDSAPGAPN